MSWNKKIIIANLLASILFLIDLATKKMALSLPRGGLFLFSKKFIGLQFYPNPNLIFNIKLNEIIIYLLIAAILGIIIFLLIKSYRAKNVFYIFCLTIIVAGAVSNLIDRLCFGYIIDFLSFFDYSIFNLSDVYIAFGAGLILIKELKARHG